VRAAATAWPEPNWQGRGTGGASGHNPNVSGHRPKPSVARPADRSWLPVAVAAAGTAVIGVLLGPVAAGTGVVGAVTLRRALRRAADQRWRGRQRAGAEEIIAALATELEAGRRPDEALRAAVDDAGGPGRPDEPVAPGHDRRRAAGRGVRIHDPLALRVALAHRTDPAVALAACEAPTLRQLAAAWRVSQHAGIPLAPLANRLAAVVRDERERDGEVAMALAGPRASGRLVASLPVAGIALGALLGASPLTVLLGTRAGALCLVVGLALDLAGLAWINRLTEVAGNRDAGMRDRKDIDHSQQLQGLPR
ncbi:type II secretion system F family protein, partial [Frankia sp. CiP1_Cm_nod1]|uniref:type II secretion system F family protein n=1 Tax=Frankia sp. CiP1_Cm_nod1 TaxID=2897160 RepID=UPI0040439CE0